jgi:hypothetical protein
LVAVWELIELQVSGVDFERFAGACLPELDGEDATRAEIHVVAVFRQVLHVGHAFAYCGSLAASVTSDGLGGFKIDFLAKR